MFGGRHGLLSGLHILTARRRLRIARLRLLPVCMIDRLLRINALRELAISRLARLRTVRLRRIRVIAGLRLRLLVRHGSKQRRRKRRIAHFPRGVGFRSGERGVQNLMRDQRAEYH